jgi:hypothetical protein
MGNAKYQIYHASALLKQVTCSYGIALWLSALELIVQEGKLMQLLIHLCQKKER